MKSNVLKNYDKELGMLILVNIGMFIYWSDNSQLWNFLEHNKIFLSFFISFLSPLLITDCIPAGWKDLLILYLQARDSSGIYKLVVRFIPHYWIEGFQRYVFLPGFCIFSNLEDNRIKNEKVKKDVLKKRYGEFPKNHEDQNDLWYKIYRSHENSPRIFPNYRYWLLLRDIVTLNVCLLCSITLFSFLRTLSFSLNWTVFMLIQIVVEILMCRRYCNKYVQYVLAEETYDIEKNPNKTLTFVTNNTTNIYYSNSNDED